MSSNTDKSVEAVAEAGEALRSAECSSAKRDAFGGSATTNGFAEVDEATAILVRARGFIERGWCQGVLARDANGTKVDPTSEHAVAWCANGALVALGVPWSRQDQICDPRHPAVIRLTDALDGYGIACDDIGWFNNRQKTVEPVLAAFDRAIAAGRSPCGPLAASPGGR